MTIIIEPIQRTNFYRVRMTKIFDENNDIQRN